ncbi:restriction endonuclease subunit S [Nocardia sp. NPDC050713]|uniref:restriction endonuclease subunit S n=1 Tax=Nocardia sp. NPDC050713 TaxID=3154511 RepID=UPI0033C1EECC
MIRRSDISDGPHRADDLSNYKICRAGDIVLNRMSAYQGAVGRSSEDGLVSPDYLVIRPVDGVESRYLHHLFRSRWFVGQMSLRLRGIGGIDNGVVRTPRINADELGDIRVALPSLEEQRRIADFLDAESSRIEELVAARTKQISLLRERGAEFERGAIAGAFDSCAVESGIAWIGLVDPSVSLVPLQRILQLQRGVDLTEGQRNPGTIPVITTAGVSGFHDVSIAKGPGVVVGRYGSAGSVHWVGQDYWPHNTTLYVKNFYGNLPRYCYYVLRNIPYDMEQARSAVPGINRNDVHKRIMPLLPLDRQASVVEKIDLYSDHIDSCVSVLERGVGLLLERRQSLITAAVTGQFDVTTASRRNLTQGV